MTARGSRGINPPGGLRPRPSTSSGRPECAEGRGPPAFEQLRQTRGDPRGATPVARPPASAGVDRQRERAAVDRALAARALPRAPQHRRRAAARLPGSAPRVDGPGRRRRTGSEHLGACDGAARARGGGADLALDQRHAGRGRPRAPRPLLRLRRACARAPGGGGGGAPALRRGPRLPRRDGPLAHRGPLPRPASLPAHLRDRRASWAFRSTSTRRSRTPT